jgi:hypothetical protein
VMEGEGRQVKKIVREERKKTGRTLIRLHLA